MVWEALIVDGVKRWAATLPEGTDFCDSINDAINDGWTRIDPPATLPDGIPVDATWLVSKDGLDVVVTWEEEEENEMISIWQSYDQVEEVLDDHGIDQVLAIVENYAKGKALRAALQKNTTHWERVATHIRTLRRDIIEEVKRYEAARAEETER